MRVGHTCSVMDGFFGLSKQLWRSTENDTMEDVEDAVDKSSNANNAVTFSSKWREWDAFLLQFSSQWWTSLNSSFPCGQHQHHLHRVSRNTRLWACHFSNPSRWCRGSDWPWWPTCLDSSDCLVWDPQDASRKGGGMLLYPRCPRASAVEITDSAIKPYF